MSIPLHVIHVAAIIKKDNKYLLSQRSLKDEQAPGVWTFPGGKVEINSMEREENTIEDALKREVMEETGVEIEDKIKYLHSDGFVRVSGDHVIGIYFLVNYKSGTPRPLEDQEQVKWLTLKEIEKIVTEQNSIYIEPVVKKIKEEIK